MQNEYFVLMRSGSPEFPLLEWDGSYGGFGKLLPVNLTQPVRLRLGEPVPRQPRMVDYHSLPEPVVSERLKKALEAMSLPSIQFVPADVMAPGQGILRYWIVHVYREVACLDRGRSVVSATPRGTLSGVGRLVLAESVLREIPLEERLVFLLAEYPVLLFHESIKQRVLALRPEGLRFVPVAQWSDATGFQP